METQTAKDRMKYVDELLDAYETKIGLPTHNENAINRVGEYLSMSKESLEKLSPEECAEIAAHCDQAAFHVQRALNREVSHVTWATEALKLVTAGKTSNYRGSFQQQEMAFISEDSYANDVFKIKGYAQQRVDRLQFLANSLHKFADRMNSLQMAKNKKA